MLTANFLDLFYVPLLELYYQFEEAVINDIARRIAGTKFDSAAWQVTRLNQSGMLYDDILKKLEILTGKSETELRQIFKQAGVKAMTFDDNLYRLAGLQPTPLNLSPAMADVLAQGLIKTMGVMRNLTLTTATSGQQAFLDAIDVAYFEVSTGSMSYTQAINEAVTTIADNGLSVIGFKGRKDQLDVAVRRA
ncbi:MAG: capsid protein, partial [Firmicutes bacterium HGW-Firmicutes-18]